MQQDTVTYPKVKASVQAEKGGGNVDETPRGDNDDETVYRTTGELPDTIDWANVQLHDHDPILRVEVSRYKGVYHNGARGLWFAEISIDGISYSLGYYEEEEKAAVAFATAVVKYRNQRNKV